MNERALPCQKVGTKEMQTFSVFSPCQLSKSRFNRILIKALNAFLNACHPEVVHGSSAFTPGSNLNLRTTNKTCLI